MNDESEIIRLREENKRLREEGARLRARLTWLEEDSKAAIARQREQSPIVNDIGQHYCPTCRKCIWEPANVPYYWRRCQYANKSPPVWCPSCGQHIASTTYSQRDFDEDPDKIQQKGEQKNGNWHYRR